MSRLYCLCLICFLLNCSAQAQKDLKTFKAFNNIRFEYQIVFPKNYDVNKDYEIAMVLCETFREDNAWDETIDILSDLELENTILAVPKVPVGKDGWGTHPIHHAFNDLMKQVRKDHGKSNQKLHLIGVKKGQEVAFWWGYASEAYVSSINVIDGTLWSKDRWDKKWYNNLTTQKVPVFAYEQAIPSKFDMSKINFTKVNGFEVAMKKIDAGLRGL